MTGTTLRTCAALLLLIVSSCRSKTHTAPERVSGAVRIELRFEYLSATGAPKQSVDFISALNAALAARGVTTKSDGKAGAVISGRVSLADEQSKDSSVGGPMAFKFVNGAYDLVVRDAAGAELAKLKGPLDVRSMKQDALKAAYGTHDETAANIVRDSAPRIAGELIEKLWELKLVTAG